VSQVDPNDVATAGVQALQGAIAKLDALKQQPDADLAKIDGQIDALQTQQTVLRDQALRTIEDSAANQQAITAMNAAAANLKIEAAIMKVTAADLAGVAKVVTAAMSLIGMLAPFI
jgi:hypothetical protein